MKFKKSRKSIINIMVSDFEDSAWDGIIIALSKKEELSLELVFKKSRSK